MNQISGSSESGHVVEPVRMVHVICVFSQLSVGQDDCSDWSPFNFVLKAPEQQ